MITKSTKIICKGIEIANTILEPETAKEKAKGMYKFPVEKGKAMVFFNYMGTPMMFDMLWMKEKLGFIAVNMKNEIVDVGILRPWRSIKWYAKGVTAFIETHPDSIMGLNKGDMIKWIE